MTPRLIAITACFASFALVAPTVSQTVETSLVFDVRFRGLTVAELRAAARETDATYAAAATMRTTGLAGAFARVSLEMQVEGTRSRAQLRPQSYRGRFDTGQRAGAVALAWSPSGPPELRSEPPSVEPSVTAVPPRDADGAVDRLTAMWRMARPQTADTLCNWTQRLYDGARLAELRLGPGSQDGGRIACDGSYVRVAGFPDDELTDAASFPLRAEFRPRNDGLWELTEVSTASIYGPVRIIRRD